MTPSSPLRAAVGLVWRAQPGAVLIVVAGTVALGLFPVALAWFAKLLVDELTSGSAVQASTLALPVAGITAFGLVATVGQGWVAYLQQELSRRIEFVVEDRLFATLNGYRGLGPFEQPRFHDRIDLALQAGQAAPRQLVQLGSGLAQNLASLAGFVGVLVATSPLASTLTVAAAAPHVVAELRFASQRVSLLARLTPMTRRRLFYSRLQWEPQAAKELRLFGLGRYFHGRMLDELRASHGAERTLERRHLGRQALLDTASALAAAAALAVVVTQAAAGDLTPGDVTLLLGALPAVSAAIAGLVGELGQGREAMLLVANYQAVVDTAPDPGPARPARVRAAPALRRAVQLDDVWFRYADDLPWVLRGVSLRIERGRSLALVGLNGAGKSTIVKLLGRLYEPTRGHIRWDGFDLRDLDVDSLRRRIGSVSQDYMTYDLTAADNIGLGDLAHRDDPSRLRAAAARAGVGSVVDGLPRGYDTMLSCMYMAGDDVEESGVVLSGGQWQRLALARMLMRADRDLLILDEPSAGLDAEAEQEVHTMVHEHTAGTTRLLVSHRLNAVRMADRIAVIDDGVVAEQGTHDELLARSGRYATLFSLQAAGYQERTSSEPAWPT